MAYIATFNGSEYKVSVKEIDASYEVKMNDKAFVVDYYRPSRSTLSVIINGRSYEVDLTEEEDILDVLIEGEHFHVNLYDETDLRMKTAKKGEAVSGKQVIKAPMPGKVVKILKKIGEEVKPGDGLIVVEAMKMENELKSKGVGAVKEIKVEEGVGVEGNAVLMVIE